MLGDAGVAFRCEPANVDESAAKQGADDGQALALDLARQKALAVSRNQPDEWVIGSDSTVSVAGKLYDKPANREDAAAHLRTFSGQRMRLSSAVALARDGKVEWDHSETATLHVRPLSEDFIDSYLDAEWPAVSWCVGVFRMEGPGVQLFDRVEGSHFSILGMPLIPLLGALRERGLLPS